MKKFKKRGSLPIFILSLCLTVSFITDCKDDYSIKDAGSLLQGYARSLAGERIHYHSPQPDAPSALLVRTTDGKMFIEWETESIPENLQEELATFVWIAGISHDPGKRFNLYIDGKYSLSFYTSSDKGWKVKGKNGTELMFKATMVDAYEDSFGYMFLELPKTSLSSGKALKIRVVGEDAGTRDWYMTFEKDIQNSIRFNPEPVLFRKNGKLYQSVLVEIIYMGKPAKASIHIENNKDFQAPLDLGSSSLRVPVLPVKEETALEAEIKIGDVTVKKDTLHLKPVQQFEVYLLPHSHYDIGYTELQTEVERKHWNYFEQAIEMSRESARYPEGSQFKWNIEVLWAVESYLRQASDEKRREFIEAVNKGWLGLQGLYANELTGLCSSEELFQLVDYARRLREKYGFSIDSAMITDIPGYTWGLVPALAQSGIDYFSSGPNYIPPLPHQGDRIGYTIEEWGDRPFYWVSPSGEEKVLIWVAGKGYSLFHDWVSGPISKNKGRPVIDYVTQLIKKNYPYNMLQLRYTIKSDNGPPDPNLASFVKEWNEKYVSPRLIISTASDMFREFERRYGNVIPSVRGDFTGYWEDGAASTARETALVRNAADRLVQGETLWAMLNPEDFPALEFSNAWRNVLLFDEHTWGAYNSVSEPDSELAVEQWKIKQKFSLEADRQSKELLQKVFQKRQEKRQITEAVDVYNTTSWARTELILIPKEQALAGDRVRDQNGKLIPSQRLSTGELAILVGDVPPLGAKRLFFEKGKAYSKGNARAGERGLENEFLSLSVNPVTGAIKSLKWKTRNVELVNRSKDLGLNDYFYVPEKDPKNAQRNEKVNISVKEKGPLAASLLIESDAPGCHKLKRELTIVAGQDEVYIKNIVDKKAVRKKEGVHFAFPFLVPEGTMRMDMAWAVVRPEIDQLPGSCKNVIPVKRWVDISNQNYGVTWVTIDAPLIEVGSITADIWDLEPSRPWIKTLDPSQTLYSYVMNNYWHTNYKADQEGTTIFRYVIKPHGRFNSADAKRFGVEKSQPLIASPAKKDHAVLESLFKVKPTSVIISSLKSIDDGKALMVRLFNAGSAAEEVTIDWEKDPKDVYLSNPFEEKIKNIKDQFEVPAFGIVTLRVEKN